MRNTSLALDQESTGSHDVPLDIRILTRFEQLDAVKPAWDAAHAADPHATVFLDFAWIRGWFETCGRRWRVVCAHSAAARQPVAFLPLAFNHVRPWYRIDRSTTLRMGGWPAADYTGLICPPEHEARAVPAIMRAVQRELRWDRLELRDVADPRLEAWLDGHHAGGLRVRRHGPTMCPRVELPPTWEAYLQDVLSAATRKTLRRRMRTMESLPSYRAQDAQPDSFDRLLKITLDLWRQRWNGQSPAVDPQRLAPALRRCFDHDLLWMRVLWDGDTPLAAGIGFLDWHCSAFRGYLMAVNLDRDELSSGIVLVSQAIRSAIERGLRTFDFLRGEEPYKFSFGAKSHATAAASLTRAAFASRLHRAAERIAANLARRRRSGAAAAPACGSG